MAPEEIWHCKNVECAQKKTEKHEELLHSDHCFPGDKPSCFQKWCFKNVNDSRGLKSKIEYS